MDAAWRRAAGSSSVIRWHPRALSRVIAGRQSDRAPLVAGMKHGRSRANPLVRMPADRPRSAGAGAARIAVVPTGTPVQKVIKAVLNCYGPIRSAARRTLAPHNAVMTLCPGGSWRQSGQKHQNRPIQANFALMVLLPQRVPAREPA